MGVKEVRWRGHDGAERRRRVVVFVIWKASKRGPSHHVKATNRCEAMHETAQAASQLRHGTFCGGLGPLSVCGFGLLLIRVGVGGGRLAGLIRHTTKTRQAAKPCKKETNRKRAVCLVGSNFVLFFV